VALGLTPEQKPIFDLLIQDDLSKDEIKQIKAASVSLLQAVRKRIEEVQDVFSKQSTRDGLRQEIYDLLYDEQTGLPASKYNDNDLAERTTVVFNFFETRALNAMAA
jgi:type I restriction enzyme, R subunit